LIGKWLHHTHRNPCPYKRFAVIDTREIRGVSPEIRTILQKMLSDARYDPDFLAKVASSLGWKNVHALIAKGMPGADNGRRGEFGESLIASILEWDYGYIIPVWKLRFKITSGESLPATDTIALKLDATGKIYEMCYIESKLRNSADTAAAIKGCEQLQIDFNDNLPDMLTFIATILYERNDPLFDAFAAYMRVRTDTRDHDTFRLSLCWEHTKWTERILSNLEKSGIDLPRLTVHVIRIQELGTLTDELFNALGIINISDDD